MAKPNEQPERYPVRWTRRGRVALDVAFVATVLIGVALVCVLTAMTGAAR